MRIGVDIDNTINNFSVVAKKYLKEDYNKTFSPTDYNLYSGLKLPEIKKFEARHSDEFMNEVKPIAESSEILRQLLNEKNQIYIITARNYSFAEETLKWLRRYNFMYTDIYFNSTTKVDVCKWKEVDFMIDDNPNNLISLNKAGIPFIVFNQPYNQDIYGEKLRSNNWNTIYDFFSYISI